jgi:hypothetical protein
MLRCRLFGHRLRFAAEGTRLRWHCARGCGAEGTRSYADAADAARYARALDREPRMGSAHRAPPFALLPLRLAGRRRGRRSEPSGRAEPGP